MPSTPRLICALLPVAVACAPQPSLVGPVVDVPAPTASSDPPATASAAPSAAPLPEPAPFSHTIDDIKLTFELPSRAWKLHPGLGPKNPGVEQVGFERDDVLDSTGHAVRPYCGVTSEPVPPGTNDIVVYSVGWRTRVPFQVVEVFSHVDGKIQLKNAIGYLGTTAYNGDEHTIMVLHALYRERGYVVVCDTTTSVYPAVKGELESILKSMRHTEAP